ncbi:MAG: hypothetical protein MPK62_07190 [Alphaproteobacteria bacterium]|nr:hypothetical protein [Gammaproteobacteria bacterium]MDA8024720.1 hypothetical protein [Gammaproteobacteria bacterium]MDA8030897.1 hypothetical protein [Alphaproteobacteria bacterium]
MFYIIHGNSSFTIIDCCFNDGDEDDALGEIAYLSKELGLTRFISTHPDEDHICGLLDLDDQIHIRNFYCVQNRVIKDEVTESFEKYCDLRDDEEKAFKIFKGCSRKWLNDGDGERTGSGINILWPVLENKHFKEALDVAESGGSPNNISPIIQYILEGGVKALWMGDLETDFMEKIENDVDLPEVDILFAPHHGRDSGKVPASMLQTLDPKIIVIGEAPSENLNYYSGRDTITQNSAGDIIFDCRVGKVHIFTSKNYRVDFLHDESDSLSESEVPHDFYYLGTLNL